MALIPRCGAGGLPNGWSSLRGMVVVYDEGHSPDGCIAGNETPWAIINPLQPNDSLSWQNFQLQHGTFLGNLACSGHTWTADGRLFVAGGNERHGTSPPFDPVDPCILGGKHAYLFDPTTGTLGNGLWHAQPSLQNKRWYPGVVLATHWVSGALRTRVLVLGGADTVPNVTFSYQAFEPPTGAVGQWDLAGTNNYEFGPVSQEMGTYPYAHLMSSGQVVLVPFFAGLPNAPVVAQPTLLRHDLQPGIWSFLTNAGNQLVVRAWGNSLLFPSVDAAHRNSLMVLGGTRLVSSTPWPESDAQMCRPAQPSGCWSSGHQWTDSPAAQTVCSNPLPPMAVPRYGANTVILPDGSFLVVGGYNNAIERYDGGSWQTAASLATFPGSGEGGYGFHSSSVLLPTGDVFVGGGNLPNAQFKRWDYQVYSPWYRAAGLTKPQILSVNNGQEAVTYGQTFRITYAVQPGVTIDKAVLIRPSSATHGANSEQRYLELPVADEFESAPGEMWVRTPARAPGHPLMTSADVTGPPGFYMLFLLSTGRVPSIAAWVNLQ